MAPRIVHELESKFGSEYGPEEEAAVLRVLRENAPTSGDACIQFEQDFAAYTGTEYARAVSNGTAALFLALLALGVKKGDRVLTTPLTWIATAAAGVTLGAEVDFIDIDPKTYNLDPAQLEKKLTPKTKAVIPVHLYGQCCDMDEILALSRQHGFAVVEDACHALGAEYKGRKAGSMGALGCFSFHEQKNISTLGEGGIITTGDAALFEKVALYRSHCTRVYGKSSKYCSIDETQRPKGKRFWYQDFDDCGYNFRMTDIQGAVGSEQLKKLDDLNAKRIAAARYLTQHLQEVPGLTLPCEAPECKHVYHLYPLQIDAVKFGMSKEDFVYAMLHEHGIKVGTHYIPLHYSTAFRTRGFHQGQFPVVEDIAERLVTLPIHPRLTLEALEYLAGAIRKLSGTA
ncbi:MAG: DegT/DnrJ/EryC1/StrS family aminotransferase [Candidatus Hydrogenedentes bacterium]|nr:DegT/DnrJ/EryC1/StrS family aminotransferase [Candidatus Hydrogenedentota bacterium]